MPLREIRRFLVDPRPELPADYARRLQYVSKTSNVRVDALDPFITGTIGELVAGRVDGPPFCVFHGRVNETDDGPVESACRARTAIGGSPPREVYLSMPGEPVQWEVACPLR
jgi:hypothetical protein